MILSEKGRIKMAEILKGTQKFYIGDSEDNYSAEITFSNVGNKVISIDRTYVSDELRGQRIAQELVQKVIDFAREEDLKIIPTCSYAKTFFEKNPADQDVLNK